MILPTNRFPTVAQEPAAAAFCSHAKQCFQTDTNEVTQRLAFPSPISLWILALDEAMSECDSLRFTIWARSEIPARGAEAILNRIWNLAFLLSWTMVLDPFCFSTDTKAAEPMDNHAAELTVQDLPPLHMLSVMSHVHVPFFRSRFTFSILA